MEPRENRPVESMTHLLVFGGDSLVGSHFVKTTRHPVTALGRRDPRAENPQVEKFEHLDLLNVDDIESAVGRSEAEVVVNFAGATDVDGVERERPASPEKATGPAFVVNAVAPEAMARATRRTAKFLISVSTDFVFDGADGPYAEGAEPSSFSPRVSWYGWTKGEGERRIRSVDPAAAVIRISYPYRSSYAGKLDFARKIVDARRRHSLPPYFSDQQVTPTWIPDVSRALEHLIESRERGVFHAASPAATTPYDFARELVSHLGDSSSQLTEGSLAAYLQRGGAAPRPLKGGLACHRLPDLRVPLTTWQDGIRLFLSEGGGR